MALHRTRCGSIVHRLRKDGFYWVALCVPELQRPGLRGVGLDAHVTLYYAKVTEQAVSDGVQAMSAIVEHNPWI